VRHKPENIASLTDIFNQFRNDYDAAKTSRYRRIQAVPSSGGTADYHYRNESDYLRMMEYARAHDRNDPIVGQGVNRLVDNVLQQGIGADPNTGNVKLNDALKKRWDEWMSDPDACDVTGERDLHRLAKLGLRATIVDGDVVFLPIQGGSLQAIEAHRIRTPKSTTRNVVHGVLLNELRKRIEFWISKEDVDPYKTINYVSEMHRVPVRDTQGHRQVFHLYNPKRLSQTRGVTAIAPIMDMIGMHGDIQFAKLVQQQIVSCFAVFRERALAALGGDPGAIGERLSETLTDNSTTRTIEGIAPGMMISGEPGERLTGFSPNVPNAEFFDHAKLILTIIAINLGLPLQVLLLDPSETNFSGWRGAIDQARMGFQDIQQWMIQKFYAPVYRWKVRQWVAEDGTIQRMSQFAGVKPLNVNWNPPYWPYIEPEKDAKADALIIEKGLNSRRAVLARRGLDVDDIDRVRIEDQSRLISSAIEAAQGLNEQYPDAGGVTWRDVLGADPQKTQPLPQQERDDGNTDGADDERTDAA
jgi:lambda family phage portal protein